MQPNPYIQTLKPYTPIAHKVYELDSRHIRKLDWNEATLPPPPHVLAALKQALEGNLQWYPNTKNTPLLRALGDYTSLPPQCIELFASSDVAHEYILQVFSKAGDRLCIIAPTYDNFRSSAEGRGIVCDFFPLNADGSLDFLALDKSLESTRPTLLYLCNPNNPTGNLHSLESLEALIRKHSDIGFVIDEAYYEFAQASIASLVCALPNLLITRTFSKAFALASFRIGYILSAPENIAALNRLRNAKNLPQLSQVAALAALENPSYMWEYVREVERAREDFALYLSRLPIYAYPSRANFILLRLPSTQADMARELVGFLESYGIFIRDYSHILPNHVRISIGTREQMEEVAQVLRGFHWG